MSKRRAPADVPPEVDDSKKPKQDLPSEKVTEEKTHEQDPPSEKSTEEKTHKPADEVRKTAAPAKEALEYFQIIITGPKGCGKSCLVLSYMGQLFPPGGADFLSKQYLHILPNEKSVMIWDLDSRDEFRRYRHQSYPEADIALLCFDVRKLAEGSERDFENLLRPWLAELEENCGDIPIILVGLKADSRSNSDFSHYGEDEINYVMRRYPKINMYKEVSAYMDRNNVNELFTLAINSIDRPKTKEMFANCGFEIIGPRWFM